MLNEGPFWRLIQSWSPSGLQDFWWRKPHKNDISSSTEEAAKVKTEPRGRTQREPKKPLMLSPTLATSVPSSDFLGISPEKDLKWQFLFISYHLLLIPYFVIVGASRICLDKLTLRWLELNTSGAFSEASPMVSPAASKMFLSSSWKILHA